MRGDSGSVDGSKGPGRGAMVAYCVSVLLPSSSQTLLIPALPRLQEDHGFSVAESGWTLSAFLIGASLSAPLVGRAGDMWGRRRPTVLVSLAYVVGSIVCWIGCDIGVAVAIGRVLQGIAAGVYVLHIASIQQLVADPIGRATRIGLVTGAVAAGPAIGFLVGGMVSEWWGVPAVFIVAAVAGTVSSALLWRWTPESGGVEGARLDAVGAVLLAAALVTLMAWISRVGEVGLGETSSAVWLGITVLAWLALLTWLTRCREPFIALDVVLERVSALGHLAGALSAAAMFGLFVVVPLVVQDEDGLGMGPVVAGLVLAPGALAMTLIGPSASRLGVRRGLVTVIVMGNALCAAGLLALALIEPSIATVAVIATVTALGVGVALPALPSIVMAAAPASAVGAAVGINSMVRGLGSALGAQIALIVAASGGGSHASAFLVSVVFAIAACGLAAAIGRPPERRGLT